MSNRMSLRADNAESVAGSKGLEWGVRAGIVCFGVVHLLIAWIALNLAFGGGGTSANQTGALRTLSDNPFGAFLLWAVAAGFVALVVWQALEARRHLALRARGGGKQTGKAVAAVVRAVVYAAVAVTAVRIAIGAGSSSTSVDHVTRELMKLPAGPLIVGAVGVAIIGVGIAHAVRGIKASFVEDLNDSARGEGGRVVVPLGRVGFIAKGIAFGVVGALFVTAAVSFDPKKAGGLDVALHTLLQQPYGKWLLAAVALGLACFGVYCFAWAKDVDPAR